MAVAHGLWLDLTSGFGGFANLSVRFKGNRLRGIRLAKSLTLEGAAEICRVDHSRLGRYERGPEAPRSENLGLIAEGLQVSSDYFLGSKYGDDVSYHTVAARESLQRVLEERGTVTADRAAWLSRVAEDRDAPVSVEEWRALLRFTGMLEIEQVRGKPVPARARSAAVPFHRNRTR